MKISIVIPALNEEAGIGAAVEQIPVNKLGEMGHTVEIIVVDNGSTDNTANIARDRGAKIVFQPDRGYGKAYKAGFDAASGDIIITGDADMTYPFDTLPEMIEGFLANDIDFMSTDRLSRLNPGTMKKMHVFGNNTLTMAARLLFGWPFRDSQSGMWIFKRAILDSLILGYEGMQFSQDLKIEAYIRGFKCAETPIDYRMRAGQVKLNSFRDGFGNMAHLFKKRFAQKDSKGNLETIES